MGCCGSTANVPSIPEPSSAQPVYQREPVQPTQHTPAPSSTGTPPSSSAAPSSRGSSGKPAHHTVELDDKINSTLPPKPHAVTPVRRRSQGVDLLYRGGGGDSPQLGTRSTSMGPGIHLPAGTQAVSWAAPPKPRFLPTLKSLLPNDFRYAIRRCPISHYLQFGPQIQNSRCGKGVSYLIKQALDPTEACLQRESGKSSLINAVFKANMNALVCTQLSLHSCFTDSCALQIKREHQLMYPEKLPSSFHATTATL
jgi:hypothetical protein